MRATQKKGELIDFLDAKQDKNAIARFILYTGGIIGK